MTGMLMAVWQQVFWNVVFSTFLCLSVLGMFRLFRIRSARIRYVALSLVLARVLLPVDLLPIADLSTVTARLPWLVDSGASVTLAHANWNTDGVPSIGTADVVAGEGGVLIQLLTALWLGGSLAVGSMFVRHRHRYRRLTRLPSAHSEGLHHLVRDWCGRLHIRRPVALHVVDSDCTPFAIGWWKPHIVVPRALADRADRETQHTVIGHELAHVRRHDDLFLLAEALVVTLFFFHPVVWLCVGRLRQEREKLCDRLAVDRGDIAPLDYGRALLAVIQIKQRTAPMVAHAAARTHASLEDRMRHLTDRPSRPGHHWTAVAAAAILFPIAAHQGPAPAPTSGSTDHSIEFHHPLPGGTVTSPFGPGGSPAGARQHEGVDIRADLGTPVRAAAAGRVTVAEVRGAYGNLVIIDHADGYQTWYAHLDRIDVDQGGSVDGEETIGAVGNTGVSSGPHLHFEIRRNDEAEDPAEFLQLDR